ncbi:hypothetical protein [Hoeflea prorocentri]|uniref:Uncharacterized protein n=1 Tax=Hoeflea prorocentri TaxID=1922333 RepID=A0A9X3UJJ4_9HYPH|nr:hypothetical protein [Hoeflea prorocentri]MCY6382533.1 hypothetical protein [Hoeflea prorocentri]MDA5400333.1 hypothetical protein [Hoeflea prorocentri]
MQPGEHSETCGADDAADPCNTITEGDLSHKAELVLIVIAGSHAKALYIQTKK